MEKPAANSLAQSPRQQVLAHLAMLAFAGVIALGFVLSAMIRNDITTVPLNTARFLFGALIMGVAAFAGLRAPLKVPRSPWRFVILGFLSAIYFITMYVALTMTAPIVISAVFTLIPLMAAAIAFALIGQKAGPRVLASLVCAGLGSIWVIFKGSFAAMLAFDVGQGEVIFFGGCISYAFYTVLLRRFSRGEPSLVASFWTLSATMTWIVLYGFRDLLATDWTHMRPQVWWVIAYLSIFPTAISFFLVQFAALRLPSAKVIAYGYLTPVFVIAFEGLGGRGWPGPSVVAGALVTVLGLVVLAVTA